MPLHMTKVAFGAQSLEEIDSWFKGRGDVARLTTRYLPKRHEEMLGGSLYWIFKHQLVGRSPIIGFEEAEGGKTNIVIEARMIPVHPRTKRAHQGWRYLNDEDAPLDLGGDVEQGDVMPGRLAGELAKLGLV
jgi:hypothetical protein